MPTIWSSRIQLKEVAYEELFDDLKYWLEHPSRVGTRVDLDRSVAWCSPSGDARVDAECDPGAPTKGWALRFSKTQNDFVWTTELAYVGKADASPILAIDLSVRDVANRAVNVSTLQVFPPACVEVLISKWSLAPDAAQVREFTSQQQVPDLVGLLTNQDRPFPVLALSEENENRSLLLDLGKTAKRMIGLAQVVRVGKDVSFLLQGEIKRYLDGDVEKARMWNVYNGAIRLYQRRLRLDGSPFDHKLWLPREVRANHIGFENELVRWVAFNATLTASPALGSVDTYRGLRTATAELDAVNALYVKDLEQTKRDLEEARESHAKSVRELEAKIGFLQYSLMTLQSEVGEPEKDAAETSIPILRYYRGEGGRRQSLDYAESLDSKACGLVLSRLRSLPEVVAEGSSTAIEKVRGGKAGQARGSLWEYRINSVDTWHRFLFAKGRRNGEVLVLTGHQKKRNDLDPQEIETAAKCLERAWASGWDGGAD